MSTATKTQDRITQEHAEDIAQVTQQATPHVKRKASARQPAKPTKTADKAKSAPPKAKQSSRKKTAKTPAAKTKPHEEGRNQELGRLGEDMACHYLQNNGFVILSRNWKCNYGEADIIVEEDDTLVFIEVKTRSLGFPGLPEYAVTRQKREKYEKIATCYLSKNPRPSGRVRFDVIAIQMTGEMQCLLRHHRDAYAADQQ